MLVDSYLISTYIILGRFNDAIEHAQKVQEILKDFNGYYWFLGRIYCIQGKFEEAIDVLLKLRDLENHPVSIHTLGYAYAISGEFNKAAQIIEELKELMNKERKVVYVYLANIYSALNNKDNAFEWLEKAFQERDSQLPFIKILPGFELIRSDPRYKALLKKIGLTE